jgi:site-specific DNA-methyltransferase (adenine-specific)
VRFMAGGVTLYEGDSREVLKTLEDNSVDSVVCDPPYALDTIVKRYGAESAAPTKGGVYARSSAGFMGQKWDTGEVAFDAGFWREVWRVLKPGGYLLAFGGTRTYHRLACAIEDAGFIVRDQFAWIYGSGFPKNTDFAAVPGSKKHGGRKVRPEFEETIYAEGWGTAAKPAWEPICVAQKPLSEKSIAANVVRWGVGGLNIRASMLPGGRWPANIAHDGSAEVLEAFPVTGRPGGDVKGSEPSSPTGAVYASGFKRKALKRGRRGSGFGDVGAAKGDPVPNGPTYEDGGTAARFFYTAKAGALDRLGGDHPTVKPVDLMRHYVGLVTPPGGVTLDPFAGSGSTGLGAIAAGCGAILIEREPKFADLIERRLRWARGEGGLTVQEKAKAVDQDKARGGGLPLFG